MNLKKIIRMLKVNEKVVCINGSFHPESVKIIPNLPIENEIYSSVKL